MKRKLLRTAAVLVGVFVFALLILWIVGGRTSVIEANITIADSPGKIFPYLTEPEKAKQWMAGVVEFTPIGEGGQRLGAKGRIVVEENGSRFEMEEKLLRFEKDRLLEVGITSSMFKMNNLYELVEDDGKTHLKQTVRAEYKGFVRVLAPFMGDSVRRQLDADFQRLKQIIEAK